jgi:hypothetical protein
MSFYLEFTQIGAPNGSELPDQGFRNLHITALCNWFNFSCLIKAKLSYQDREG